MWNHRDASERARARSFIVSDTRKLDSLRGANSLLFHREIIGQFSKQSVCYACGSDGRSPCNFVPYRDGMVIPCCLFEKRPLFGYEHWERGHESAHSANITGFVCIIRKLANRCRFWPIKREHIHLLHILFTNSLNVKSCKHSNRWVFSDAYHRLQKCSLPTIRPI